MHRPSLTANKYSTVIMTEWFLLFYACKVHTYIFFSALERNFSITIQCTCIYIKYTDEQAF